MGCDSIFLFESQGKFPFLGVWKNPHNYKFEGKDNTLPEIAALASDTPHFSKPKFLSFDNSPLAK